VKSCIFWDITPCNPLKVNRRFGGTCRLHLQGRRISQARNQSESRWQARSYIPEDRTLHNHRCENLKSYTRMYYHCTHKLTLLHKPRFERKQLKTHRAGWRTGDSLDLYLGSIRFESRPGHPKSWCRLVFFGFTQFPQANVGVVSRVGHDRFLPNGFQFTFHELS
jgi:hypothetical protein